MSSGGLSIGELVGTVSLNDQFSGPINNVAKALGVSSESFKAITGFAGLAAGAMVGATSAIVALGIHGAEVADVSDAFDQLTSAAGSTSEAMLGALREGTLGTISNFDLMKASNNLLATGMVKSAGDMGTLAKAAQLLADRTGGDTAEAFDTLSRAMATGQMRAIKQVGDFSSVESAADRYAASIHKLPSELTAHEIAAAKSQAILAVLRGQLDSSAKGSRDFGDNIKAGKVAVENFTDNLAVAIARSPVVAAGMKSMGDSLTAAFGGSQQDTVKTLMGFVNNFAIGLTYVGQIAVTAATVFVTAWSAIKTVVLTVITAVAGVGTVIVDLVSGLADMATKIPGVGDKVAGFAVGAKALSDSLGQVTAGLVAQTAEAAKGVVGNSDLHRTLEGLNGGLILARDKMIEVRDVQVDLTAKGPPHTKTVKDLGDTYVATAAQIKAYEDAQLAAITAQDTMTANGIAQMASLQDQIAVLMSDGITRQLLTIQQGQDAELAQLQTKYDVESVTYANMAENIRLKYGLITAAAIDASNQEIQAAIGTNLSATEQSQLMVDEAIANYARMLGSGKATYAQLLAAAGNVAAAEKKLDEEKTAHKIEQFNLIANAAKQFIGAVFGKGKAASIATAIIDTAQAVVKALASAPPPLNYVLAAAVGVAGLVQINKIRSTDVGFAQGTPGTMFQDFGRGTSTTLHGPEAVVTKAQGESVAGMVEDALRSDRSEIVAELRQQREDAARDRRLLPIYLKAAVAQGMA